MSLQLLKLCYVQELVASIICCLMLDRCQRSIFRAFFLVPVASENGRTWKSWVMLSYYAYSVAVLLQHKIRLHSNTVQSETHQHSSWEYLASPLLFLP